MTNGKLFVLFVLNILSLFVGFFLVFVSLFVVTKEGRKMAVL